jgi:spore germination cell wall hydrolase CwlJ-like protein
VIKLFGGRIASALVGISVLAMGSSASAQDYSKLNVSAAVKALNGGPSATSAVGATSTLASALARPAVATTTAVASPSGAVFQAQPAQSVTLQLRPSIAREAAWLYHGGWPLYALVAKFASNAPLDPEMNCLATAVYFEARGESLEGQLAVARVVINRAASGRYPPSWCQVVKQPYQFSFVNPRSGQFPVADTNCDAWKKAEAIAELAAANVVPSLGPDVLWYHADYVAPSWGRRLNVVEKIGAHIFYGA